MRHSRSLFAALLAVLPIVVLLAVPGPVQAATWVWPSFSCFQTLQNCIDSAAPGDIVEVASHGPIAESLTIEAKSLTLRPHPGFIPVFAAHYTVFVRGGSANVTVIVQGMTLKNGRLISRQDGAGVFDVRLLDNTILDSFSFGSAIEVSSTNQQPPYGPVVFTVTGNRISMSDAGTSTQHGAIAVGGFLSTARGKISGNTILESGPPTQVPAIGVWNDTHTMTLDVLHNEVRGSGFNSGISLFQQGGGGKLTVRVINNLVVGQVSVAGAPGGISLSSTGGTLSARVVNNTVAGGDRGIYAGGRADLGGQLTGVLANNLVVGHRQSGISIEPDFQTSFVNERNLSFRNVVDSFVPGPGTLFVDPLLLTANDYRLRTNSPARDAGSNAQVPGDVTLDLAGMPRIQGAAVAMGAYER